MNSLCTTSFLLAQPPFTAQNQLKMTGVHPQATDDALSIFNLNPEKRGKHVCGLGECPAAQT